MGAAGCIFISEWEWEQAAKSSHTTPSFIVPNVSECRSPQPATDDNDTQQRRPQDNTNSSSAACPSPAPHNEVLLIASSNDDDDDEEDSDKEIGPMIYSSSNIARVELEERWQRQSQ